MLRILLSIAGVLFIGLGLFGGELLNRFMGDDASGVVAANNQAMVVPATTVQVVSDQATDQAAALIQKVEVPASAQASTNDQSAATSVAVAQPEPATDLATVADQVVAAVTPAEGTQPLSEEAVAMVAPDTADSELNADGLTADGAEPIAPAQPAGDLIAMAEQAKSTNRNEQVDIANTLVAAVNRPQVETASVAKNAEAKSVVVSTTGDLSKDGLIVIKDKVNLRDGPSINHPIVITLQQGQELMEFKRDGKWVHVGAYGTEGKIGWVHERLVGAVVK